MYGNLRITLKDGYNEIGLNSTRPKCGRLKPSSVTPENEVRKLLRGTRKVLQDAIC